MCDETGWWHNRDVTNNFGSTWTRESVSCSGKRAGLLNWCISSTRWQSCTCDRLERCLVVKEVFWDIINTTTLTLQEKEILRCCQNNATKNVSLCKKGQNMNLAAHQIISQVRKLYLKVQGFKWCRPGNEAAQSHDLSNGDVICVIFTCVTINTL